jgi:hypothetical protein
VIMGLYDCMYLVPKEQYQNLAARGQAAVSSIDGVGGDVQDSQVNNIEVANGGTVLIRGTPPSSIENEDKRGGSKEDTLKEERIGKKKETKTKNNKDGFFKRGKAGKVPIHSRLSKTQFAARSQKLSAAKHFGNTDAPDYRRKAILNDIRKNHPKKRAMMNDLMQARLAQLQGKKSRVSPPEQMDIDRDKNMKIVHEMRDVFRDSVKKNHADPTWEKMDTFSHNHAKMNVEPSIAKKRVRGISVLDIGKDANAKRQAFPQFKRAGKRMSEDELSMLLNPRRGTRAPDPPPKSAAAKRKAMDEQADEDLNVLLDPLSYLPSKKIRNMTRTPVRSVGKFARVKRKGELYDDEEEEVETTGLPYKMPRNRLPRQRGQKRMMKYETKNEEEAETGFPYKMIRLHGKTKSQISDSEEEEEEEEIPYAAVTNKRKREDDFEDQEDHEYASGMLKRNV